MCKKEKKVSQNHFYLLTKCNTCNLLHLSFNNVMLEFTYQEFESFCSFIDTIDTDYWVKKHSQKKRSIPIKTIQENLYLMFSEKEINDLKNLLSNKAFTQYEFINSEKINYSIHSN